MQPRPPQAWNITQQLLGEWPRLQGPEWEGDRRVPPRRLAGGALHAVHAGVFVVLFVGGGRVLAPRLLLGVQLHQVALLGQLGDLDLQGRARHIYGTVIFGGLIQGQIIFILKYCNL